ncbi:MAG: alpha/beta hydrolase [Verrucomicrobia bacterium]|nr:alpha/beta hydrolase [Verrucomicrobiota bacterium]MBU6446585.1 alpha/beta hydrolase [Verrucomicrobiota bacterium]MDE3047859.1 alpha/beta hydrolase [Verrucomicrobiota bacterium]
MRKSIVFIPGLLSDERVWQHQMAHLREVASLTAIRFQGENHPQAMVEAILKQSPPRFTLVGHSMGGWLALEVMRYAPQQVDALCLINTTARPDSKEKAARRKQWIQMAQEGQFSKIAAELARAMVLHTNPSVENMFSSQGPKRFIDDEQSMLQRKETFSILPTIQAPTLVIHATQDRVFTLEEHQELTQKIPHAQLALVEDSGHMSPMEQPVAVTALLRYWFTYR